MRICFRFGTDGWYVVTRFVCFLFVSVRGLISSPQTSLLRELFELASLGNLSQEGATWRLIFSSNIFLEEFVLRSLKASPLMKPYFTPGGWDEVKCVYWNVSVGTCSTGPTRVEKSIMFQYLFSTIVLDFMEFPDDRCHGWKLWMSKLSSESRLTVTCHMCSEQWICRGTSWYVPLINALLWSLSSPSDTFFRVIRKSGRPYRTKEAKQKKRKKKKRAIKDHKNDWLTVGADLKLFMKNKWTKSSF